MSDLVTSDLINNVLHVSLNRENKKNALTSEMYSKLTSIFAEAKNNDDVRVLLFKGSEGCFSAGNDITDFLEQPVLQDGSPVLNFLHELVDFDKPLIAAASGPAVGIGTTFLLHCDLVYATNKTLFSLPFVNLGLCPEAGSSYLLPRQLGYVNAAELLFLGESFDAQKALRLGLINEIVDEDSYWSYAQTQAEKLATKPALSLRVTKNLLRDNAGLVHEAIDREASYFAGLLESDDAKAIFKKFLDK